MINSKYNKLPPKVVLWGGTGQAKVVRPIVEYYGSKIAAVVDDTPGLKSPFEDVEIYQGYDGFKQWLKHQKKNELGFCICIGNPYGQARIRLHDLLEEEGLKAVTAIHPTAWISKTATIGAGCQIMAGAIIEEEVVLGRECIINTKASVDHECVLDDGVEIAPGATLCGCIHIGVNGWVCAGATVLPRVKIGENAIAGAGAVVVKDVPAGVTVVGVPAKEIVKKEKR